MALPLRNHWYARVAPEVTVAVAVSLQPTSAVPLMTGLPRESTPVTLIDLTAETLPALSVALYCTSPATITGGV